MESAFNMVLDLLRPFTGTGGGANDSIIRFLNSAFFWVCILLIACLGHRRSVVIQDRLLLVGVTVALFRDLFMAGAKTIERLGFVDHDTLHIFFPPFEHALFQVAIWTLGAGMIHYLTKDKELTHKFLRLSLSATLLTYLATFYPWAAHIMADPSSKFGQTWYDLLFHTVSSVGLITLGWLIWRNSIGTTRRLIMIPIVLFFLAEFLKIPDILTGEVYEKAYAPFRHLAYTFAVPAILVVYLRDIMQMNGRAVETEHWRDENTGRFAPSDENTEMDVTQKIPENTQGISVQEANDQVSKILRSEAFLTSRKSSDFLRYTAARAVEGNLTKLNAYDIAVNALGQHEDFIPSENAIVRVTALRLRELLKAYYETEGRDAPIRVTIPRGTYEPQFARAT